MLNDILTAKKGLFLPGTHSELRGQLNRSRRAALLSGNLVQNTRSDISGVSARVYKNGTFGFSSMAELSPDAAEAVFFQEHKKYLQFTCFRQWLFLWLRQALR